MATAQGVVLFVPDSSDGVDMRIGIQRPLPNRKFTEWKKFGDDKAGLLKALSEVGGSIPEPVNSAIHWAERSVKNEFFL